MEEAGFLKIVKGEWSPEAAAYIAGALATVPLAGIRHQVETGRALLFEVRHGAHMVGAYVLRLDCCGDEREGVIVAAGGRWKGGNLAPLILPHAEAQFKGISAVRIHTARPGLVDMLAKVGYRPQEFVMRKELRC